MSKHFERSQNRTGMTASEAVKAGFIEIYDNTVGKAGKQKLATLTHTAMLQARGEETTDSETMKESACPPMEGANSICGPGDGCDVRNLVVIKVMNAKHLPSEMFDTIDPYVVYWAETTENQANTKSFSDQENPMWNQGCPFAYSETLNFDGEVWDADVVSNDKVACFGSGGTIDFSEEKIAEYDGNGDGEIGVKIYLYDCSSGEQMDGDGGTSYVNFNFKFLKAPGYSLVKNERVRELEQLEEEEEE